MTHIVSPSKYPSKKAFKEAVAADPAHVYVDDPSIFDPVSGSVSYVVSRKQDFTVTNHPKRSWFARVYTKNGKVMVE